jgi:hypothetical protein
MTQTGGKKPSKPGETAILLGFSGIVCGLILGFLVYSDRLQLQARADAGTVTPARVEATGSRRETYESSKGRQRTRTVYTATVAYDFNGDWPYAKWKQGIPRPPVQFPAPTSMEVNVSSGLVDDLPPGRNVMLLRVLGESDATMLVEDLEYRLAPMRFGLWMAGAAAAALAGLGVLFVGMRQRQAARRPDAATPVMS